LKNLLLSHRSFLAVGEGKSKKEAKNEAAAKLLNQLIESYPEISKRYFEMVSKQPKLKQLRQILSELCIFENISPSTKDKEFVMRCSLPGMSLVSFAKSKSMHVAKWQAVKWMLKFLQDEESKVESVSACSFDTFLL
jgi:dsRNA-specific ribonuclease